MRSWGAPYWDLPKANVLAAPTPPPLLGGAPYWSRPYWPRPYWAALTGHRRPLLGRRHRRCRSSSRCRRRDLHGWPRLPRERPPPNSTAHDRSHIGVVENSVAEDDDSTRTTTTRLTTTASIDVINRYSDRKDWFIVITSSSPLLVSSPLPAGSGRFTLFPARPPWAPRWVTRGRQCGGAQ